VVSMRLVRMLCPRCKDRYVPTGDELRLLGVTQAGAAGVTLFRPAGCDFCGQSGYRGRTGVFEILELDEALRRLITTSAPESVIRRAAVEAGMIPIGEDGLAKVLAGETSLEELQRVVFCEEESGRVCPACRGTVSAEFLFCPHCGEPVGSACVRCQRRLDAGWHVCPFCGHHRGETPAVVPSGEASGAEPAAWTAPRDAEVEAAPLGRPDRPRF